MVGLALGDRAALADPVRGRGAGELRGTGRGRWAAARPRVRRPARTPPGSAAGRSVRRAWAAAPACRRRCRRACRATSAGSRRGERSSRPRPGRTSSAWAVIFWRSSSRSCWPCGSNAGQVGARQRHEERLLPVVRHEAVARVQVAELLVGVDLFLGLVGADDSRGRTRPPSARE